MEALKQLVTRICQSHKISKKDDDNIKGMVLKITSLTPEQTKILENLKSGYVKKDDIEQLTKLFDDVNKQIDVSNSVESEIVSTKINSCDVEDTLDKTVAKYSGFSEKHPMDYVSYDETCANYKFRHSGLTITNKKLTVICDKVLKNFYDNFTDGILEIVIKNKIPIKYAEKNILVYNTVDDPLFDIQHIFSLLGLEQSSISEKYDTFKQHITHFGVHKNQYGGYIIREFVSFKIMCQIIMSSNKKFAKKFKEDVSEILDNLRQTGQLTLSQNTLSVNTEHSQLMETHINSMLESGKEIQSYDNPAYNEFVKNLIIEGSKISITPYMDNHVMYIFVTTLKDPSGKNRILCKVGYTYDIVTRLASLRSDYGCKFYQIAFKIVKSEQYEKDFHKMIKTLHRDLHVPTKCKNKDKDEIYVFDKILYNEFMNIKNAKHVRYDTNVNILPDTVDVAIENNNVIVPTSTELLSQNSTRQLEQINDVTQEQTKTSRYDCPKCKKHFRQKSDYDRHLKRKFSCSNTSLPHDTLINSHSTDVRVTVDTLPNSLMCTYCKRIFARKDVLTRHLVDRCKVKNSEDHKKDQLIQKLTTDYETLKVLYNELNEKFNTLKTTTKKSIVDVQTQKSSGIKIIPYGKENMISISDQQYVQIINKERLSVQALIEKVHFDKNKPENQNIYIQNMRTDYIVVYDGEDWKLCNKTNTINTLYDNMVNILDTKYRELVKKFPETPITKFKRFSDKTEHDIKEELKLMLYNHRKLVKATRKLVAQQ